VYTDDLYVSVWCVVVVVVKWLHSNVRFHPMSESEKEVRNIRLCSSSNHCMC